MSKKITILMVMIVVVAFFAGCGKTSSSETASKEAVQNLADLTKVQQGIAETYDENDPAAAAKIMENYAEWGAQFELKEFEKAEAVDAPSDFPSSLIYGKGKVTESSDYGDESYINKSITIQTTEDVKTVRDFYKNLFSQLPWKLTSQSSESGGASYGAIDTANIEASVYISSDPYSKIVDISVTYSGYIAE